MADGDQFADVAAEVVREVDDRVVLNIWAGADDDFVDVTAQPRLVPNAGFLVQGDPADHVGTGGDEGGCVDLRGKFGEFLDGHAGG